MIQMDPMTSILLRDTPGRFERQKRRPCEMETETGVM